MGGLCSSSLSIEPKLENLNNFNPGTYKFRENVDQEDPGIKLRLKILEDVDFSFPQKTIFLLFAPPAFPLEEMANYVSKKVKIPVIVPTESIDVLASLQSPNYVKGGVFFDYPHAPKEITAIENAFPHADLVAIFFNLDSPVSRVDLY
jgi:hypothetical protein